MTRSSKASQKPVVLITGATGDIGLAVVRRFLVANWIVVGTTRGQSVPGVLSELHIDVQSLDVRQPAQTKALLKRVRQTYGRLDAMVLCAGYGLTGPLESVKYDQAEDMIKTNLLGATWLVAQALPIMRQQGYGVVVGLSSIAGRVGIPGFAVYSGSKFGLEGVLEALWFETAGTDIKVRLVEPSIVNSAFWQRLVRTGEGPRGSAVNRFIQRLVTGSSSGLQPAAVAEVVYRATISRSTHLRYPIGLTMPIGFAKRLLPESLVRRLVARYYYGPR